MAIPTSNFRNYVILELPVDKLRRLVDKLKCSVEIKAWKKLEIRRV